MSISLFFPASRAKSGAGAVVSFPWRNGAMKLEVRVDEADVGQVTAGQRATFTVDAYPGRTFQANVLRVDVGANASGSTTSGSSASNAASSSGTGKR